MDGLVGHAKMEVEVIHEGEADPFEWDGMDYGYGTLKDPIIVPSLDPDGRAVMCMCEGANEDGICVPLTVDDPLQRCPECGCCYELVEDNPVPTFPQLEGEDFYEDHGDHH